MNCDYTGWWPKHIIARAGENFSNSCCQKNGLLPKIGNFCNSAPSPRSFRFFPQASQVTHSVSISFIRGYWRKKALTKVGKKKRKKKEQKGKEAVRRRKVTFVFHLQNCFSMYVILPFWILLQLSWVYSSLHRAGGRWDNSDSSVPCVHSSWVSPRLRQKRFPCPEGRDRRVMGIHISSTARQESSSAEGAKHAQGQQLSLPYIHTQKDRTEGEGGG